MKKQSIIKLVFVAVLFSFFIATNGFSQPNAPENVRVVPRYEATISLIISWDDMSDDETGFEIERREVGDVVVEVDDVGAGVTTYQDNTATADKMWEYRVRALGAGDNNSAWVAAPNACSPKIEWPMGDGSRNILHNYGNPLGSAANILNLYFHNGVDISGSGVQVNAARGGIITNVIGGDNGGVYIEIDCGALGTYSDVYWHLKNATAVVSINDILAPGDYVGPISDYFSNIVGRDIEADHTHWGTDLAGGGGKISPLTFYTQNTDRDPNTSNPVVTDASNDGDDFIVVDAANNNHTNPREPAYGDVDFLVDAYDDMAAGFDLVVSPHSIGYWVQPTVPGAESVQNSATPYLLIAFNYSLCGAGCSPEPVATAAMYSDLPADLHGINTWQSYYTWVVTNTDGTDGDEANVDENQFWRTNARKGTGVEPNGSDAQRARENQEARFPDGTYYVHVVMEDHVHTTDNVRSVLVDNSRPYVKRVTVYSGVRIVYQAQWVWDETTAQLAIQPTDFDSAAAFSALRTQDITIEVEFSEPMETASISAVTPATGVTALGVVPALTSTQPENARTIWRGLISNLDIADDGTHDGVHMLTIDGTDLAGNALLEITNRANMGADHHNRDAVGALRGTAGTDTIHGFRISPLESIIPVTAIFMKQTVDDPVTPTVADKALTLQQALNDYFDEVSYEAVSFAISGYGWYQLSHPLDWYETSPRTPLIDLVQEAIDTAEADGVPVTDNDYLLVVTDETAERTEWSTNGAWPYNISDAPGWKLIAAGTLNLASSDAHVTNLTGRMIGLIDLFAYPEVSYEVEGIERPFVGPWSHMSDKEHNVHVLGWEKWRAGWLDETGSATGKTITRVAKPPFASPIADQDYTISAMDSDSDAVKMVALEIGDRLHYTAEYRRQQNLDSDLLDAGVVIVKANDYINQGEGPAIVQESNVTAGDLNDAPFNTTAPRNVFDDVGSGVNIEVTGMDADQAQIRLNYQVPPTENDVYVTKQNAQWETIDIWVDAPDLADHYEADPLTVIDANEKPVVDKVNKVYGRVRNQGHADATNFEVHLEIREPWGAGGPWRSLNVETVPLLQGQDTNPNHYFIISADWEPSGDVHSCVKLSVHGVANDVNSENNWTQENIHEFETTTGSPYAPVVSRFEVENPYDESIIVFFKLDGLPSNWAYILSPERLVIPPHGVGSAQVILQPHETDPVCSREVLTVSAYTPRVDTLKQLGGITLQIGLKNPASVTARSWVQCGRPDPKASARLEQTLVFTQTCYIHTQGCTDPALPNTQVAVVYTAPDGSKQVRYVTTDESGCYVDTISVTAHGRWETQVVVEETECREEATTPPQDLDVPPSLCGGSLWCCWLWLVFLVALIAMLLWLARWLCGIKSARLPFLIAFVVTVVLAWLLFNRCAVNLCWFWPSAALAVIIALLLMILMRFVPCIGWRRTNRD